MIKKFIKLYWHEADDKSQEHRTLKKSYARWRRHGFEGMQTRLEKEYKAVKEDFIVNMGLEKRFSRMVVRVSFALLFLLASGYFLFLKSELYESRTAVIVRDIGASAPASGMELAILGMGSSSQLQDSKVVEEFLRSLDLFMVLDKKFMLVKHFKSDALDFVERLGPDATVEQNLEFYRKRLHINYDEVSGVLHIAYAHTSAQQAQEILHFVVKRVEAELNEFNRRKAKKQLTFIEEEFLKQKMKMEKASTALEVYQNQHSLLDPKNEATSASTIIASLEASLTEKNVELSSLRAYLNDNNYEVKKLRSEIRGIKRSISKKKKGLSGSDKERLNKTLFEYERLRMALELQTEIYKNALIQLESTKVEVSKSAKTLSVVSKPNLPDGYSYPNKPKTFITIVILFFLLYGIFTMLTAIIRDHKE